MANEKFLDLYGDYILRAFGQTTATGLSALLNGEISDNSVQRFLVGERQTSVDLWRVVKPHVRKIESPEGVLIVDDSIAEKPYPDENDIICWYYDHSQQRNVKGINFVTCLYHNAGISLPVGFELIAKTKRYADPKDGKEKRRSSKTKNEYYREMTQQAFRNQIQFKYVLNDVCFAAAENMLFVKTTLEKDSIMPLKSNRKVAVCLSITGYVESKRLSSDDLNAWPTKSTLWSGCCELS